MDCCCEDELLLMLASCCGGGGGGGGGGEGAPEWCGRMGVTRMLVMGEGSGGRDGAGGGEGRKGRGMVDFEIIFETRALPFSKKLFRRIFDGSGHRRAAGRGAQM